MIDQFITELRYLRNVSPKTLDLYKYSFKTFEGALESRQTIIQRISELNVQPVSVNTYLRCINAYFMWLHKEHGKELVKIPKLKEEQRLLVTLSEEGLQKIISFRGERGDLVRAHLIALTILDTGLRASEVLGLTKEDCDIDNMVFKVAGKGGKHRLVPFSCELRKVIYRTLYNGLVTKSRFIFGTKNNTEVSVRNLERNFKVIGKRIGYPSLHPHMLRHSYAVNWIRKGGDLFLLSRVLGHSDIKTTAKYLRGLGIADIAATSQRVSLLSRR